MEYLLFPSRKVNGQLMTSPEGSKTAVAQLTRPANLCAETLDEPIKAAHRGVERVRSDEDLLFGFLRATGLSL
jgi:hypothetical protein